MAATIEVDVNDSIAGRECDWSAVVAVVEETSFAVYTPRSYSELLPPKQNKKL